MSGGRERERERVKGWGGPHGPRGWLLSRTHLSLKESAKETLESDIQPPLPLPSPTILLPPSFHFRDAMHDGHCHSASRVTLSPSPGGEYQCIRAFGRYAYNTSTLQ